MRSYCVDCKKEVSNTVKECVCGCKSFLCGSDIYVEDKKFVCECGSREFTMGVHIDFTDRSVSKYTCDRCYKAFVIETHVSPVEMSYWE